MGVQDTSVEVYQKEVEPNLGQRQKIVLEVISKAKRPVNNQEIADHLGVPINTITPRTNELVKLLKVEIAFKDVYPKTNRRVCYWKTV